MMQTARSWRVLVGGVTVGIAAVVGFAGTTASAEPVFPPRPTPAPPTVAQSTTVAPGAISSNTTGTAPAVAPAPAAAAVPPGAPELPAGTAPPVAAAPPAQPTLVPARSGTIRDYLQGNGVILEPQKAQDFNALDIALPMPPGWTRVPDPNVIDPFVVIANRSGNSIYTSNAQLVVYKLIGNFDPREAITHGFVDSQQLAAWRTTDASLADFNGFPSSIIEGTYRQNDLTLNTSHRHVLATSGPDTYLVSLAVTTGVGQAIGEGPATNAIIRGFRVSVPGSAPPDVPQADPAAAPSGPVAASSLPAGAPSLPAAVPSLPAAAPAPVPGVPARRQ